MDQIELKKLLEAKQEVSSLILNKIATQLGFEKTVKYIADSYNIPYNELQHWVDERQKEISQHITKSNTKTKYEKVEIIVTPTDEDIKNYDLILSTKEKNVYKKKDAIALIKNKELLVKIYKKLTDHTLKREVIRVCGLEEIYDMALKEKDEILKIETIKAIHNRMKIRWAAESDESKKVRIEAIKKITDAHTLQKIILQDADYEVRKVAINQIKSVSLLDMVRELLVDPALKAYIANRINALNGSDDYVKKSIENLIHVYH